VDEKNEPQLTAQIRLIHKGLGYNWRFSFLLDEVELVSDNVETFQRRLSATSSYSSYLKPRTATVVTSTSLVSYNSIQNNEFDLHE